MKIAGIHLFLMDAEYFHSNVLHWEVSFVQQKTFHLKFLYEYCFTCRLLHFGNFPFFLICI